MPAENLRGVLSRALYGLADVAVARQGIRRRINGELMRFPAAWSRYYPREYESSKHRFVREHCRPSTLAIDIGAHIGLFTVAMGRAVGEEGRVLSLEPTPGTCAVLRRTVSLNGLSDRVEVRCEAAGRERSRRLFYCGNHAGSNANSLIPVPDHEPVPVQTASLDELIEDRNKYRVSCIKIDAEGAEYDVLIGGRRMLELHRPCLAVEIHPALLEKAGYILSDVWDVLADLDLTVRGRGSWLERDEFLAATDPLEIEAVPRELA